MDIVLTGYDYSDVTIESSDSGTVTGLSFTCIKNGKEETIDVGDVEFEYYHDSGDICIDFNDNLKPWYYDTDNELNTETTFDWGDLFGDIINTLYDYELD